MCWIIAIDLLNSGQDDVGESIGGPCSCSGTRNAKKQGGKCDKFDYTQSWCYVSISCDRGYVSQEVAGAKWITGCDHAHRLPNSFPKKLSIYDQEKMQLGEGLEAASGQGLTRSGWSWGVILASQAQYPACINLGVIQRS